MDACTALSFLWPFAMITAFVLGFIADRVLMRGRKGRDE